MKHYFPIRQTIEISLHAKATAQTLANARILICLIWLVRLASEPIKSLGYLDPELFHAHGIMKLIPFWIIKFQTDPTTLLGLQICIIGSLIGALLNGPVSRWSFILASTLITYYLGFSKGMGGHINHRELILLYVTYLLLLLPCYDNLPGKERKQETGVYQASMLSLCGVIVLGYFYIAVARIAMGFPKVFYPDTMKSWLVDRMLRPNPTGFQTARWFFENQILSWFAQVSLPLSTLLELMAPLLLFLPIRKRFVLCLGLALMHIMIFLTMNILFIENIFLLLLFFDIDTPLKRQANR